MEGGAGKIRQVLVKLVRKGQALPRAGAEGVCVEAMLPRQEGTDDGGGGSR